MQKFVKDGLINFCKKNNKFVVVFPFDKNVKKN